jgi:hypothetical protein
VIHASEKRVDEGRDRRALGERDQKTEQEQGQRHGQQPVALPFGQEAGKLADDG